MNRLICSFSGGRTSGYMTWRVLQQMRDQYDEITVLFANTGLEHEKTLEFVNNCDKYFGFNTVWLEAVTNMERGKGETHKVVTFETANRDGEPYYRYAEKHGIPDVSGAKCTASLKINPMRSYVRDVLGHTKKDYKQCIGIRADEIDRMQDPRSPAGKGLMYPLVSWGVTKGQVLDWWAAQEFGLDLPEHLGNCVTCFKKSDRKLYTIAKHYPEYFEPFAKMERDLSMSGPRARNTGVPQRFFRKHRTTADIIASSKTPFIEWTPTTAQLQIGMFSMDEMAIDDLDLSGGCEESCEVGAI